MISFNEHVDIETHNVMKKKKILLFLGTFLSLALIGQDQINEPLNWRLDSIVYWDIDEKTGSMALDFVTTYEYKDTLVIQENFNPETPACPPCTWFVGKVEFYYDVSCTLKEINAGPGHCFWGVCWGGKWVYSYNPDGTLVSIIKQNYYEETNEWEPWGTSVFYTYDYQKNLIEEMYMTWDKDDSGFIPEEIIIHEYMGGNRVASNVYSDPPDFETLAWKYEREFDQYGNCLREIELDFTQDDTIKIEREYEYDEFGLLLKETEISGDGDTNEYCYAYNNDGDLMEIKKNIEWGAEPNIRKVLYYYSDKSNTKVLENTVWKIKVYPNPVINTVTIRTLSEDVHYASIIDLNGRINMNIEWIGPVHQLDLSSFLKGIYFITVRSEDFVTTRKIIKL